MGVFSRDRRGSCRLNTMTLDPNSGVIYKLGSVYSMKWTLTQSAFISAAEDDS
jgi:hypothetical protein